MMKQRIAANYNGHVFESMMIPIFEHSGYIVFYYSQINKNKNIMNGIDKYVIRNVPFTTIYNSRGKTEFVIVNLKKNRRIRVESKYQRTLGSVDEKYPYMLLNGIYQYPENEIVFVVDGDGYKPGAIKWLKDQINNNWLQFRERGKDIKLMNIQEFMDFFRKELY